VTDRPARALCALAVALAAFAGTARAATVTVCTAADVIAGDPSCPATGACNISQIVIINDGCTLDFGTRAVTLLGSGELRIRANTVTIKSGSFSVAPGGFVNLRGDQAPPNDNGGVVSFITSGAFLIDRAGVGQGRIDASAIGVGGSVSIDAGTNITIRGRLQGDNLALGAVGGSLNLFAGGDIHIEPAAMVTATGGLQGVGGTVTLAAKGSVLVEDTIDVRGGEAGVLFVDADGAVNLDRVIAFAGGDAGTGGTVIVSGGTSVQVNGSVAARGNSATDGSFGGDGGILDYTARFGDLTVNADMAAEGAAPDGIGGSILLQAVGSVVLGSNVPLSTRGNGGNGDGGDVTADAKFDVTIGGSIDVTGGLGGGSIDILAGRHATVSGALGAQGRENGGFGGAVFVVAGSEGQQGSLTVGGQIDAGGGGCSTINGCGAGGGIDLFGCDITVTALGEVLARGPSGGAISLNVRELLTVNGPVKADFTSAQGAQGAVAIQHPSRRSPVIAADQIAPPPDVAAVATCTGPGQFDCIDPCPACGNGVIEFPETCDQAGTPVGCDGCSTYCMVESCDDQNGCTTDSCAPTLGCRHVARPDGISCSDGLGCNGAETCLAGLCRAGQSLNCNDGNACTLDGCAEPGSCTNANAPAGTGCNDNNLCTLTDQCNGSGQCTLGVPRTCVDGRECTTDSCNPASGCVFTNRTGPCTDDGNQCTDDTCGAGNCTHPARSNGTACDDGLFCTTADGCFAGICLGTQLRSCADTNSCTTDTCNEITNQCDNAPVPLCCGNGIVEGTEQCDAGAANSNAPNATCRTNCLPARCGDGVLDDERGEQCDDTNATSGDGCSAICAIETPSFAFIPGRGAESSDCVVEWRMNHAALDPKGRPNTTQTCGDNDPLCDFDPAPGVCLFHLQVCVNVQDPNVALCVPASPMLGTPATVMVQKPSPRDALRRPEDALNRAMLLSTVAAAKTTALNACGPELSLRVPLRSPTRSGSKTFALRTSTGRSVVDSDRLKLSCLP
jgi:cysteine-rich repeat protein